MKLWHNIQRVAGLRLTAKGKGPDIERVKSSPDFNQACFGPYPSIGEYELLDLQSRAKSNLEYIPLACFCADFLAKFKSLRKSTGPSVTPN